MNYRLLITIFSALALSVSARAGMPVEQGDIPVSPVSRGDALGWSDVFHLRNAAMEVVVDPAEGRIVHLKLHHGAEFLGAELDAAKLDERGHLLLPVDREEWSPNGATPAYLAQEPWDASAWEGADGSQSCRMSRKYGSPLNVRITRTVKLDEQLQLVSIRQRIQRTDDSEIPVLLLNIVSTLGLGHTIMPTDNAADSSDAVEQCDRTIVYEMKPHRDNHICPTSSRSWIAAQKGEFVMIQKIHGLSASYKSAADCQLSLTTRSERERAEIELRSEKLDLKVGDSIENTISIHCYAIETNVPPCRLSQQIEALLGER